MSRLRALAARIAPRPVPSLLPARVARHRPARGGRMRRLPRAAARGSALDAARGGARHHLPELRLPRRQDAPPSAHRRGAAPAAGTRATAKRRAPEELRHRARGRRRAPPGAAPGSPPPGSLAGALKKASRYGRLLGLGGEAPGRVLRSPGRNPRGSGAGQRPFGVGVATRAGSAVQAGRRRLEPQPATRAMIQLDRASFHLPAAYIEIRS